MAQYKVNDVFSSKIQEAILSVCSENYSSQGVEIDGIVCVSFKNPSNNCIVKIHRSTGKENSSTNVLNTNVVQRCDRNSSNLPQTNVYHNSARLNYLDTGNECRDEQIYYDDGLNNDSVSENVSRNWLQSEKRFYSSRKRDRYFICRNEGLESQNRRFSTESGQNVNRYSNDNGCIHNTNQDVDSHTDISRFSTTESGQTENGYSEDTDTQSYVYQNSGEVPDGIKVEQDERQEMYTDWNRPFQQKDVSKKSNLETIIERFSSQGNPLTSAGNHGNANGNEANELQDNYNNGETDSAMHIENYGESDNNEIENDDNPMVKYSNPVCIDLSESDPDLYEVQSELDAHENSESNRSVPNYNSDDRHFESYVGQNEKDLSSDVNSLMTTQTNNSNQSHIMKNFKSLPHFKRTFHVPFRRPQLNQSLPLIDPSNIERRKVYCQYCGVGFTNSGNKNRHERSTCGAVKYKCEFCDSLFSRSDSRTRHMLYCHGLAIKDRQSNLLPKKYIQKQTDFKPNTISQSITASASQYNSESQVTTCTTNNDNIDLILNHEDKLMPEVTMETLQSNSCETPVDVETGIPES